MLDPKQTALFRLMLDKASGEHEASAALRALKLSLEKSNIDAHKLVSAMNGAKGIDSSQAIASSMLAMRLASAQNEITVLKNLLEQERRKHATAAVARSYDPGETVITFGFQRGKKLNELSSLELRRLRIWCEGHEKFPEMVEAINLILGDR